MTSNDNNNNEITETDIDEKKKQGKTVIIQLTNDSSINTLVNVNSLTFLIELGLNPSTLDAIHHIGTSKTRNGKNLDLAHHCGNYQRRSNENCNDNKRITYTCIVFERC